MLQETWVSFHVRQAGRSEDRTSLISFPHTNPFICVLSLDCPLGSNDLAMRYSFYIIPVTLCLFQHSLHKISNSLRDKRGLPARGEGLPVSFHLLPSCVAHQKAGWKWGDPAAQRGSFLLNWRLVDGYSHQFILAWKWDGSAGFLVNPVVKN